jgi:hypothetical protein
LWHIQLGAAIYSTAVSYQIDGKQYIVIPSGSALFAVGIYEHCDAKNLTQFRLAPVRFSGFCGAQSKTGIASTIHSAD